MSDFEIEVHLLGSAIQTSFMNATRIECFHSRGQNLCKFIETKESVCIRKVSNSQRIGLGHQHGRRFIVLGHQYGRLDVMWQHSISSTGTLSSSLERRLLGVSPYFCFWWSTSIFGANHHSGTMRNGQKDMIFLKFTCITRNMKNYVNNFKNSIICSLTKSC